MGEKRQEVEIKTKKKKKAGDKNSIIDIFRWLS